MKGTEETNSWEMWSKIWQSSYLSWRMLDGSRVSGRRAPRSRKREKVGRVETCLQLQTEPERRGEGRQRHAEACSQSLTESSHTMHKRATYSLRIKTAKGTRFRGGAFFSIFILIYPRKNILCGMYQKPCSINQWGDFKIRLNKTEIYFIFP